MPKSSNGVISKRILKCIKGIEKHGFRLERQQEELEKWLNQNSVNENDIALQLEKLTTEHNGKPLIKRLQKLGMEFEENIDNEEIPLYKEGKVEVDDNEGEIAE